jgi:predicted ATP-dependent serine protease
VKIEYSLDDFAHISSARKIVSTDLVLGDLPTLEDVRTLATWTPELLDKFNRDHNHFAGPPKKDRSAAMSELAHMGAELGWSDENIAAVLYDADDRWGKYKYRRDRDRRITDFINRARQKHGYNSLQNVDLARMIQSANQTAPVMGESKLIYGYQDFVEAEFKIEWILSGLLAQGGFGLITGYPGTGKTQFSIALGAHMALGSKKFLTWDNVAGNKKVLFLSLEMSAAPLNHFMGTIGKGYDDKNTLNRNFLVAPFGTPINLDTPEGQVFFDQIMNDHMPDILVIDSLQKISSKELTDEQAVKNLIHYLSTVRAKYSCAMLMIHHNRKKANDGQKKGVELSDVYGSTYITTDVDFVVSLRTIDGNLLQVDTLKNRLGPTFEPFNITRNPDDLSFTTDLGNIFNQFAKDNDIDI